MKIVIIQHANPNCNNDALTLAGKKDELMNRYTILRCDSETIIDELRTNFISMKEQFKDNTRYD